MGRLLSDSTAEPFPPSATGPDLWAQIVDELSMGLVYSADGGAGASANRFARNLLSLPPADIAPQIPAEELERLGIQLNSAGRTPPEPDAFSHVRLGRHCYTVTSFTLKGSGPEGRVWWIREAAPAAGARPTDPHGALVPSVGHEFNNLLGRVICLAEEIQEHQDPQKIHERAETLIEMAERGAEVVRRLMTTGGCSSFEGGANIEHAPGLTRTTTVAVDLTPDTQASMTRALGR